MRLQIPKTIKSMVIIYIYPKSILVRYLDPLGLAPKS